VLNLYYVDNGLHIKELNMTDLAKLYYTLGQPATYATEAKIRAADAYFRATARKRKLIKRKSPTTADIRAWLEQQDTFTLHRPLRKKFTGNPFSLNNILSVVECDLIDV
jgi:hypothetical protein